DAETDPVDLDLSAVSSNTALVPPNSIVFDGSGTRRTVTITPTMGLTGTSTITILVSDGRATTSKSFLLTVRDEITATVYLPLAIRNHVVAPDLIVKHIDVTVGEPENNGSTVHVVIANAGRAPTTQSFWVDLYVNPSPPPAGVNEVWNDGRCLQGIAWGIQQVIWPGETVTLTLVSPYLDTTNTHFDGASVGDVLYVQVDAANMASTYGGVQETHEILGEKYNNIAVYQVTSVQDQAGY
ncbi:MAG: hypothetical protein JXA89_26610, partial [Anaerolineae bacterium]|nr:hypothetical protein [Anaerolineae bacterium]